MPAKKPIRRTQLISPWGVGQMINFPKDESLMVVGLDMWEEKFRTISELDEFKVTEERLAKRLGVKEFRLFRIFNRAGQKVFETTNPAEGWDGTVNGIAQPLDTYVWMVEAVSKYGAPIRENGLVTILR